MHDTLTYNLSHQSQCVLFYKMHHNNAVCYDHAPTCGAPCKFIWHTIIGVSQTYQMHCKVKKKKLKSNGKFSIIYNSNPLKIKLQINIEIPWTFCRQGGILYT